MSVTDQFDGRIAAELRLWDALELPDMYAGNHYDTELRRAAGHLKTETSNDERTLGRAIGRMRHIDDHVRLTHFLEWLNNDIPLVLLI